MDFSNDKEPWGWHNEDRRLQKTSNFKTSQELWNGVPQNEENISYMFNDETTPVKACGDFYHVSNSDNILKEPEECRDTSALKRRRMLQFHSKDNHFSLSNEEMPSTYLKSNGKEDLIEGAFPEISQWVSDISGRGSASGYEDLELSAEGWLAECFNDAEMQCSPDNMVISGSDDVENDVAELRDIQPASDQNFPQHAPRTPRNIVFKGRKSLMQMSTKLPTSVAYPFAFIKPCGAQGDVTLKEINQRIQTPPPLSKSKQIHEDPSAFPKSAFSGKPVVGKTKIRTEGGKGSITIMRTKG